MNRGRCRNEFGMTDKKQYKLFDTHAHFDFSQYEEDRAEVMARAKDVCGSVVTVGVDIETSEKAAHLARENDFVFAAVGVHPHEIVMDVGEVIGELKKLAGQPKVVAVGETGLDFKSDQVHREAEANKERQIELFRVQVELAKELNKPVIVHARDSWEDLIPLLKEMKPRAGVVHSWTGNFEQAKEILDLGFYISFSGMLTYPRNEGLRNVAREVPLERIVIETDAPFLPPQSKRGQRNEPAYVKETAEKLAEVRRLTLEEVSEKTTENATRLFSIAN